MRYELSWAIEGERDRWMWYVGALEDRRCVFYPSYDEDEESACEASVIMKETYPRWDIWSLTIREVMESILYCGEG